MKRNISLWQFVGFSVTSLLGTLLHFLYEWSRESILAAPFSGVNESTWEHMKLLYFPLFAFAIIQSFFFKEYDNFWCVKLRGILLGLILIPVIFYTYNGIFGKSPDWVNIGIFFVTAAVTFIIEARMFKKENTTCNPSKPAFVTICLIGILFIIFTFFPPRLPIFEDPVEGGYGILCLEKEPILCLL